MRSIRLLAGVTAVLTLGSACGGGDDGGNGPNENTAPVAAFNQVCTELACVFTDASTDPDGTIAARSWSFGDATTSTEPTPSHVYATAGVKTVVLTVTDNDGATNAISKEITLTTTTPPPPVNMAPTASFDLPTNCTAGTPCGFHSTSTDADGVIAATQWTFGEGGVGTGADVTQTFVAAGTFTVTMTVTDDDGATGVATQQLTVLPAASQGCTTTGGTVNCSLSITQRVTVKFTIVSVACELTGNRLTVTAPRLQTAFGNICNRTPGEEYTLTDIDGNPLALEAGTQLAIRFEQGTKDPEDPASGDAGIEVDGSSPNWTLRIDDGGNAGAQGEPDFDDAVINVVATPAP